MFFKVFFFNKTSFSIRHLLVFEGIHAELALICSFPVQRLKALLASCFSLQTRNTMQAVGAGGSMCMVLDFSPDSLLFSALWQPGRIRSTILARIGG